MTIHLDNLVKQIPLTALEKLERQRHYRIRLQRNYQRQLKERIRNRSMIPFAGQMFEMDYEFGRNGE